MIQTVAQAVVDALNGVQESSSPFSLPFTAERKSLAEAKLSDLETLQVLVMPSTVAREPFTRATDKQTFTVDIGVRQKLGGVANTDVDPMLELVQELSDYLSRLDLDSYRWKKTENSPVYDHEELRQKTMFASVLRLTYEVTQ